MKAALVERMGSSLSFMLLAAIVALATGCRRAAAQQVPADAGLHISDALKRDPITRDAAPLRFDGGPATAIHAAGGHADGGHAAGGHADGGQ
jgi:hypothetical protein